MHILLLLLAAMFLHFLRMGIKAEKHARLRRASLKRLLEAR